MRRQRTFIILAAVLAASGWVPVKTQTSSVSSVDVLLSSDTDVYAEGLAGIQSVFKAKTNVTYLDALPSPEEEAAYFRRVDDSSSKLLIAIGGRAARAAYKSIKRKPILFSMVNSPRSLDTGSNSLCGVSMDIPVEMFFRTLREIRPGARRVSAFYSTDEGGIAAGEGDYNDLKFKLLYTKRRIERGEIDSALSDVQGKTDAFYVVADPLFDRQRFETLSNFCRKNHIVLMASFTSLIRMGATFGVAPDYGNIGVLTGRMAQKIASGASTCADEGVALPDQFALILNEKYAAESGVELPDFIKERARLAKLFRAGVNLFKEGKSAEAREIFQAILTKDPNNSLAAFYNDLITESVTGSQTAKMLEAGDRYYAEGQFARARMEYEQALRLNPALRSARQGAEKSIHSLSEQERAQGVALETQGKPFDAIRLLQRSLATYPDNAQAAQNLAAARGRIMGRIPDLLKTGVDEYNRRNYPAALSVFEDVILVEPGHRQAAEYLRLSRKKLEAIQRLRARQK